jgi:hypothetical protein
MDLNAKTTAALLGPDGTPIKKPATFLTNEEAELLRQYQAFGEREGLQGAMTCSLCGNAMEVYVQGDIGFFCDCRILLWRAS